MLLADDLEQLLLILPKFISDPLKTNTERTKLIEIVLDVGRRPEARFLDKTIYLSYRTVVWQDIDYVLKRLGKFNDDNRAGIEKTLHRISSMRNRKGNVIGFTCRIGRAVFGTVGIIRDLLEKKKSILLMGRPGVGKTTAIREIARVLSDDMKKRVIIIDTSNEIAGDGDLPHPSIGKARRMQVLNNENQHQVMIEAVQNHMPEIIIIDEIGTELEASAARTIAERGVQLVGTAHGHTLDNIIKNPTLTDLIGGIQYVTLGDEEARRRGSSKSILERKTAPTFEIAVEIHDANIWVIHENIQYSVDLLLQGQNLPLQKRRIDKKNNTIKCELMNHLKGNDIAVKTESSIPKPIFNKKGNLIQSVNRDEQTKSKRVFRNDFVSKKALGGLVIFLYVYGINGQDLKSLIKALSLPIIIIREIQYADAILALGNLVKNNKKLRQISNSRNISIYTIQNGSLVQLTKILKQIVGQIVPPIKLKKEERIKKFGWKLLTHLEEVRLVIEEVSIPQRRVVDLIPQLLSIRKLQYEIINHYNLKGVSIGEEPNRYIRIYPN